jgi:hypothetical protein
MNSLLVFSVVLRIHIFFGAIALFVAPAAMLTRKGGLWHRRWGKMFFWSITVVAVTAVVMSLIRSGLFLLLVALFSFYLAFTGYRVLSRKTPQQSGLDGGFHHAPWRSGLSRLRRLCNDDFQLRNGRDCFWRDRSLVRDIGHARFSSSPGGQNGVVVQPYDENAGRLYCHGNGVFGRELSISTAPSGLALGDGRRDRGYRYLDEILSKEV